MTRRALTEQVPLVDIRCAYNQECTRSWRRRPNRKLGRRVVVTVHGLRQPWPPALQPARGYLPFFEGRVCVRADAATDFVLAEERPSRSAVDALRATDREVCFEFLATSITSSQTRANNSSQPRDNSVESESLKVYSVIAPSLSITLRSGLRRTETRIETWSRRGGADGVQGLL